MGKTHIVIPDPHAHFLHNNNRALWAGALIADVKPDVVVMLGDLHDMPSLSGYDKGRKCFQGRTYTADIESGLDFNDKLWAIPKQSKKKLPRRIAIKGNHEQRIDRAIQVSPELDGAIGYSDLQWERWYDTIVEYNGNTPGLISIDSILYAHYMVSGIMGRPVGGEHPGYTLVQKLGTSATVGHSHLLDYCIRRGIGPDRMGLVAGCFFDYDLDYAGVTNQMFWRGLIIKRNVENGTYDPEFVSMQRLQEEYGHIT